MINADLCRRFALILAGVRKLHYNQEGMEQPVLNPAFLAPAIISMMVFSTLIMVGYTRRSAPGATLFTFIIIGLTVAAFGQAMQLLSRTSEVYFVWVDFTISCLTSAVAVWLLFTIQYNGYSRAVQQRWLVGLALLIMVFVFFIATNPWHQLYRTNQVIEFVPQGYPVSRAVRGPLYWLIAIFNYTALMVIAGLFVVAVQRTRGIYRQQALIMLAASLVPGIVNFLFVLNLLPVFPGFDLTIPALAVTGILLAYGLFRHRLFDLVPVARSTVLDNIQSAVIVIGVDQRIADVNPAAGRILGRLPEALVGQPVEMVIARFPDLDGRFRLAEYAVTEIVDFDASLPTYYEARVTPVRNVRGQELGCVVIIQDITERKRTEKALEEKTRLAERLAEEHRLARDEAESANRAKSTFLANMSHELRTPLNAIIGYSEMLAEDAGEMGAPRMVTDLQSVQASAHQLLGLVNQVLDLSKIEAGRMSVYLEWLEVRVLLDEVLSPVRALARQNQNQLQVVVQGEAGRIYSDAVKVRQVLLNLLSNANKFTQNGTVAVTVWRETVDGDERVCFSVQDDGIGMTDEQLARVFQPFIQGDASTTRKYGGTGLGLTISRLFCRMLGGDISVESVAGVGSTFTVWLPAEAVVTEGVEVIDARPPRRTLEGGV